MRFGLFTAATAAAAACTMATPANAAYRYTIDVLASPSGATGLVSYETGALGIGNRGFAVVECDLTFECPEIVGSSLFPNNIAGTSIPSRNFQQRIDTYFDRSAYTTLGSHQSLLIDPPICCGLTRGADAILTVTYDGVPEPATWTLMIAGFGAVAAAKRRSRRAMDQASA